MLTLEIILNVGLIPGAPIALAILDARPLKQPLKSYVTHTQNVDSYDY